MSVPEPALSLPPRRTLAALIAIISGLWAGSGRPFMLRCMHSLTRSSMSVMPPVRPANRG